MKYNKKWFGALAVAVLIWAVLLIAQAPAPPTNLHIAALDTSTPGTTCTTTISSGGNVATALSNVAAGGTVCLNAGTYSFNATVSKSSMTTVTAAQGVSMTQITFTTFETNTSSNLRFDSITISGDGGIGNGPDDPGSTHIKLTNSRVVPPGSLCIQGSNDHMDVVIDNVDFGGTGQAACGEGRLDIRGACHNCDIVIKNSTFGPGGASDGIQISWGTDGVTIGPDNMFVGIGLPTGSCGSVHCDAIQPYGAANLVITSNYFYNVPDILAAFDCESGNGGTSPITMTNNIMYQDPDSGPVAVNYVDVHPGDSFTHNTLGPGTEFRLYGGNQGCASSGVLIRDNIMQGGCSIETGSHTTNHNLIPGGGSCAGTGGINGSPTYVGGSLPTTRAGWQLTSGSLGHLAASDGLDMGAITFD